MLLGLQLFTVRDVLSVDFEGTLKVISELGYDGVEFAGLYGKTPDEIRTLCVKYNLAPISAHISISEMQSNPNIFEDYKKIGCQYAVIPSTNLNVLKTESEISDLIDGIRTFAEKANSIGLKMLYHNHDYEFRKLSNGTYFLDSLYDSFSADLLGTELDTCWVKVAGEDPAEYILKYSRRAPLIHLHDFRKDGDGNIEFEPIGNGMQDVKSILNACFKADTQWIIVEQDFPSKGARSLDEVKTSIENLKNFINTAKCC